MASAFYESLFLFDSNHYARDPGGIASSVQSMITDLGGGFWLWSFDIAVGAGLTGCLLGAGNSTAGQIVTILGASLREPAWTGAAPGWTADVSTGVVTFLSPPSVGANLTAGFEFDVPVRFDTDEVNRRECRRVGSTPAHKRRCIAALAKARQMVVDLASVVDYYEGNLNRRWRTDANMLNDDRQRHNTAIG